MNQEKINRINELARKSKEAGGLTQVEKEEQALLRQEYRDSFKRNLEAQLGQVVLVEENGDRHPLEKKQ